MKLIATGGCSDQLAWAVFVPMNKFLPSMYQWPVRSVLLTVCAQEQILAYIHDMFVSVCNCMLVLGGKKKKRRGKIFGVVSFFRKIMVLSKSNKTHKRASGSMYFPQNTCVNWGKYQQFSHTFNAYFQFVQFEQGGMWRQLGITMIILLLLFAYSPVTSVFQTKLKNFLCQL